MILKSVNRVMAINKPKIQAFDYIHTREIKASATPIPKMPFIFTRFSVISAHHFWLGSLHWLSVQIFTKLVT